MRKDTTSNAATSNAATSNAATSNAATSKDTTSNVVGIDVSKGHLDVWATVGPGRRFANSETGIAALLEWLGSQETAVAQVVYEPTGGYERPLAEALRTAGLPGHQAHPNRVRAYARARGQLAKTDRLDAQALARYGAAFDAPEPRQPEPADEPIRSELRDLLRRREQLVKQRVSEGNRLDKKLSAGAAASTRRHVAWLDAEIAQLEAEYQALLASSETLSEQAELYRSVPGIGRLAAATLVAELPELGRCEGKAVAALSGLAPWANDSGRHRGHRSIRGGRGSVRRVLYLAAQSAAQHHPGLRPFYQGLCERGKAKKVALVAVMRKLLLQLNAIARRGAPWVGEYAPGA